MSTQPMVQIYSDGSCLGNPGRGGWAAILRHVPTGKELVLQGGFAHTTNNRMEILSVVEALRLLKEPCCVDVYSDSQYVCHAIEKKWLMGWRRNNWQTSQKKPVKNRDLWEALWPLLQKHTVTFHWLRGHAGHPENERCDAMAREAAHQKDLPVDVGMGSDDV